MYYFYDSIGNLAMIRYYTGSGEENYNYYVATNSRGDVEAIYRGNGTIKARYIYDTWGKVISVVNENGQEITSQNDIGLINPIRYRGYYYDQETGYYYLQSRYYDPDTGRFLNGDDPEIIDGSNDHIFENNLFVYCFNNPVNMTDDNGNWPKWATNLVKVGIGALAIGIGVAATVASGGTAAPVLLASIKIAAMSAVTSAAVGTGVSVVSHRILTGSWKGVGKAALTGIIDGACDGFMWGGIAAGAAFATAAAKGIRVQEIGRLKPLNKPGDGYPGVKYQYPKANGKYATKSIELHSPHRGGPHNMWHWQQNKWHNNGIPDSPLVYANSSKHWTLFGRRF